MHVVSITQSIVYSLTVIERCNLMDHRKTKTNLQFSQVKLSQSHNLTQVLVDQM